MPQFFILVDDCILESLDAQWQGTQRIELTKVQDASISTVFLGMDHIGGLFETMIFGGPADGFQIRSDTAQQAREIHRKVETVLRSVDWLHWHLDGNVTEHINNLLTSERLK